VEKGTRWIATDGITVAKTDVKVVFGAVDFIARLFLDQRACHPLENASRL
jgi:hypothetical protein